MLFEPTEENLCAVIREREPKGMEFTEEMFEAFFAQFEEVCHDRVNEYYEYVIKHVATGKCYEMTFNYDSWQGIDFDYPVSGPVEVELKEVTIKQWVPV